MVLCMHLSCLLTMRILDVLLHALAPNLSPSIVSLPPMYPRDLIHVAVTPDSPRYARCNYTVCFFRKGMFGEPIVTIQATRDEVQIREDNHLFE